MKCRSTSPDIDFADLVCGSSFPCPECGNRISSEDRSGEVYSVEDFRIEEGTVQDVIIQCRCGAGILLFRPVDHSQDLGARESVDCCEIQVADYDLVKEDWLEPLT